MGRNDIAYFQGEIIDWLFHEMRSHPPQLVRMITYSFVPQGWVKAVLDRNMCQVYCSGPMEGTPQDFADRWPRSRLILIQDSHAKALIVKGTGGEYYGFFGSLNMVPTSSMEITCRIVGARAEEMFFEISALAEPKIQLADIDLTKLQTFGVQNA